MARIRPFAGIHFARRPDLDFSKLIAPPYDVLDDKDKAALQARHPNNIVTIDLPHTPPKTVGPDAAYERANAALQAWLNAGVLIQDPRPATYPYMQTFTHAGRTFRRRGFIALVKLSPFGEGEVVPHEKTYAGPIEDRLKLMRETGMQLSPIFGLYSDPRHEVTNILYRTVGRPDLSGTLDGVRNDLWSVIDADIENQVIDLIKHRPIYIADGHHRYTTALQFQKEETERHGGKLPPAHPANWCMFVLVGMQDDGLLILPTHRLIGGLTSFNVEAFKQAVADTFEVTEMFMPADRAADLARTIADDRPHTFGLYDGASKQLYTMRLKKPDVLKNLEPKQSDAWRALDVSILQRYLLDEVLQPKFAGGKDLTRGYTADAATIPQQVDGQKFQVALLLQPTPLHALEDLGKHNEVMPQKSTYFFPKLATGMVMASLR